MTEDGKQENRARDLEEEVDDLKHLVDGLEERESLRAEMKWFKVKVIGILLGLGILYTLFRKWME